MAGPYYKNRWGFAQCACEKCMPHLTEETRNAIRANNPLLQERLKELSIPHDEAAMTRRIKAYNNEGRIHGTK